MIPRGAPPVQPSSAHGGSIRQPLVSPSRRSPSPFTFLNPTGDLIGTSHGTQLHSFSLLRDVDGLLPDIPPELAEPDAMLLDFDEPSTTLTDSRRSPRPPDPHARIELLELRNWMLMSALHEHETQISMLHHYLALAHRDNSALYGIIEQQRRELHELTDLTTSEMLEPEAPERAEPTAPAFGASFDAIPAPRMQAPSEGHTRASTAPPI